MALWTTINFRELKKKNMLIIGPTGVGKTAIFKKVKKILNLPLVIFPVPGLSQAGYVGRSVDEILKQVYYEANGNIEEAEKAIIILDEIDKIAQKGDSNSDVSTSAVQELFEKEKPKIGFENNPKIGEKKIIDTDRLINYGLKRELVGRLPITVELNQLGKEELKDIVMNSDESELIATVNVLKLLDIEIENLDEVIDIIVEDAITKKIGARGLIFTINNIFQEIFYEVGNNQGKYKKVIIGPNIIKDNQDFKLITKKQKTRTRKKHTVNR